MKQRLPRLTISPTLAVDIFRKYSLHLDLGTARRWLLRHRQEIERGFRWVPETLIEDVLLNACSGGWPDPAFEDMYKAIEEALDKATRKYLGGDQDAGWGSSWDEKHYCRVVRDFMSHNGYEPLLRMLPVKITFDEPATLLDHGRPAMFYLTYAQGAVTATLKWVDDDRRG